MDMDGIKQALSSLEVHFLFVHGTSVDEDMPVETMYMYLVS
jgi:hypothetical protein